MNTQPEPYAVSASQAIADQYEPSYTEQPKWWQVGVVYQVYPRSFQDSNGDGIGDLAGIVSRLDYLQWLGIDAIWISPIYPSPMADHGYDISDYTAIHPLFGDLEAFDVLVKEAHLRGIKVILDFVPNHTSNEHPWFKESRSARDNPKRDWYLWHDDVHGQPPNNWLSVFGGPAWEWDEHTGQYYYHAFLKEQPDLNWRNPEVQEAMLGVMKFWLDRGVDGFRVDVMWHMIKDKAWRDNPTNPDYNPSTSTYEQLLPVYSTDQPEVHDVVRRMRSLLDEYDDRLMIGEVYLPIQKLVSYYGVDNQGAHLPFNFQLITLPWSAPQIAAAVAQYEAALPQRGWPNWVLGNHDQPRVASRIGQGQARVAAMLLLTLRGTPTVYYGDELGMYDTPIPPEDIQDPQGLNMPDKNLSRDPARSPMQWDESLYAGFSSAEPWLPVNRNYARVNVAQQMTAPDSILSLYRRLLALRRHEPAFTLGSYIPIYNDEQLMVYVRAYGKRRLMVALNLSHRPCYLRLQQWECSGTVVLSTDTLLEDAFLSGTVAMGGDEGLIIDLNDASQ